MNSLKQLIPVGCSASLGSYGCWNRERGPAKATDDEDSQAAFCPIVPFPSRFALWKGPTSMAGDGERGKVEGIGAGLPERRQKKKKGKSQGKRGQSGNEEAERAAEELAKVGLNEDEDDEEGDPTYGGTEEEQQAIKHALEQLQGQGITQAIQQQLQNKLSSLVGKSSGYLESLSPGVRARVEELKRLQEDRDSLHQDFLKEKRELERKYEEKERPLFDKRARIVSGEEEVASQEQAGQEDQPGVPEFWLVALKNCEELEEYITEKDEEALKHLLDIRAERLPDGEPGFVLHFIFQQPNPFFTNTTLSKTYRMADDEEPMLQRAEATPIEWKQGKQLTVKVMKRKPKKPGASSGYKRECADSFFNFFSPPQVPESADQLQDGDMEQLQEQLELDYAMGVAIKDKVVPSAVRWFTGEALAGDDDEDDEEEDEEEDDDDDDEEEVDEEEDEDDDDDDDEEEEDDDDEDEDEDEEEGQWKSSEPERPQECKQQ